MQDPNTLRHHYAANSRRLQIRREGRQVLIMAIPYIIGLAALCVILASK